VFPALSRGPPVVQRLSAVSSVTTCNTGASTKALESLNNQHAARNASGLSEALLTTTPVQHCTRRGWHGSPHPHITLRFSGKSGVLADDDACAALDAPRLAQVAVEMAHVVARNIVTMARAKAPEELATDDASLTSAPPHEEVM
jgi:hypothetical protein